MPTDTVDVDLIERLAEKIKNLIGVLERTRSELSQTTEDNLRLSRETEHLKAQLASTESTSNEVSNLLAEREQIRKRVGQLLERLEEISV